MALGVGGALLHVLNHSLFKGLLFLSAGAVMHDAGTGQIEKLGGLARRTPVNALVFLVGGVAICALPPLNGFLSEFLIYKGLLSGLLELPHVGVMVMIVATGALTLIGGLALAGFSKLFAVVFLGEARDTRPVVHPTPLSMNVGMMLLAVGCVVVSVGVAGLAPLLGAALRPVVTDSIIATTALQDSLTTLGRLAMPLCVFVIIVIGLVIVRRRMPLGAPAGGMGGTWGCGFTLPTTRMQYTASSYTWSLGQSFRQFLRPKRMGASPLGCFPNKERLSTQTADMVLERGYEPTFKGLASFFERLWPLQHGRIQLYLVYIVATVVIAFLVEATFGPNGRTTSARKAPTVVRQIDSPQIKLQGRS
jgi:NADH:ubiquinone oxidoreductase subunit 5 (subunit L)/multisubunit Na+/H+ antiporter MnhA subunit